MEEPLPDRWRSIEELYHAALDQPPDRRAAYLDEACADEQIKREVESLLGFASESGTVLSHSPQSLLARLEPGIEPGANLGPYLIGERIGEGGMGQVYRARDTRLGRDVALKILPAAMMNDAVLRARLVREAQTASRLNHPNIVTIYDIGESDSRVYIAMEYVAGKTLRSLIPRTGLPLPLALRYAVAVADALAKAHGAGLVHRDLKPANIMVTPEGAVKVLDFGLAKRAESPFAAGDTVSRDTTQTAAPETEAGLIMGTPAFMSPEQAAGKPVDSRSDIFSFGAVLYEMVSGQRAFRGDSAISTLAAVIEGEPAPLSPAVSRDVARIVTRCLSKDPSHRYQHAGDLRIALEDVLADAASAPSSATIPTPARRIWFRWSYLGIAAAVVLAWAAGWRFRSQEPPLPDLDFKRLTGDPGLTSNATISPDGRLIAYASDRAGNGDLDIWVQHRGGGSPIRVTQSIADEFEPSFSQDGSQIVYAAGDGVYLVPVFGGEPRQLVKGSGSRPRLSPDGKRVVYQNRPGVRGLSLVYLIDVGSANARQLTPNLSGGRYPVWSPDGKFVLLETAELIPDKGTQAAWRLISADTLKSTTLGPSPGIPEQWLPGDRILFTTFGDDRLGLDVTGVMNLGVVAISPSRAQFTAAPRQLTNGAATMASASMAADGTVVIAVSTYVSNLWNLPLDANSGKVTGPPVQLTRDSAHVSSPTTSRDGKRLAFSSSREGGHKVWLMDMASHRRRTLTPQGVNEILPFLSPDGTRIAYLTGEPGNTNTMVADVTSFDQPGVPQTVCDKRCIALSDWWADNRGFLTRLKGGNGREQVIAFVPARGGGTTELTHSPYTLYHPHFSPDNQWLVFNEAGKAKIAPLRNGSLPERGHWHDAGTTGDYFQWSPDGNTLYFVSERDGFRCIWGRRLNPVTKQPLGDLFPVYHAHSARLSMSGLPYPGPAVARTNAVFVLAERAGNIWIGKMNSN
jgi:serine/threonine protein kinase